MSVGRDRREPTGAEDPLIGQVVAGRYEVVRPIGRGAMGAIYEVRHKKLNRAFAMKVLTEQAARNKDAMARFQREADIVGRLRHPNVVEVIDIETLPDGSPCMVMEMLSGEDLATRLKKAGPTPWSVIVNLGGQVLSALEAAHAHGIVHRDLKPQNIFLARDDLGGERCKLLDFGVSKIRAADSQTITQADKIIGTPAYMSPEQADGRSADVAATTDVWAMGAILYELATGHRAFEATSTPAVLYRICYGAPDPITKFRPDAPGAFVAVVARALSRDPAARFASAADLHLALEAALGDAAALDRLAPRPPPGTATTPGDPATMSIDLESSGVWTTLSAAAGEQSRPNIRVPAVPSQASTPRRSRTLGLSALGLVVAGLLAVGAYVLRGSAPGTPSAGRPAAVVPPPTEIVRPLPASPVEAPPPPVPSAAASLPASTAALPLSPAEAKKDRRRRRAAQPADAITAKKPVSEAPTAAPAPAEPPPKKREGGFLPIEEP